MTPQRQQEYCIGCGNCIQDGVSHHRPRCKITRWFLDMYDVQSMISTIGCIHDTRSRPAPSVTVEHSSELRIVPNGEEYTISQIMEIQRFLKQHDASIRNKTLDAIMDCAETDGEWFRIDGTDTFYLNYSVLSKKVESLRSTGAKK